ncbi:unnamed protein product [Caenorhabditis auriculariae]|uniref:Uncharacterized protein n=1 Tax=Caenorhabditis auriculariae TaxID=2777116 RepID=A0A8S1HKF4_9PELO|nr:unnamed protein product [Caenorhabditis auriculariae]
MEKQESQEILTDEKTIRFFFPKFLFYGYGILGLLIYLTFCGFDKHHLFLQQCDVYCYHDDIQGYKLQCHH